MRIQIVYEQVMATVHRGWLTTLVLALNIGSANGAKIEG
jgi:hypothetical protein